jgi:hypothetical protein
MNTTDRNSFKGNCSKAGADCAEIALRWRTSTYSSSGDGDCVEVAPCPDAIHVRDSKARYGGRFTVSYHAWTDFLSYAALDDTRSPLTFP